MTVELKMPESNSKKDPNKKNIPQERRGFLELLKNIIKALFNSVIDLPQYKQYKNYDQHQEEQKSMKTRIKTTVGKDSKSPEDLDQEKVKEAAKGLKEKLHKCNASNQSAKIRVSNQTSIQGTESSKAIER